MKKQLAVSCFLPHQAEEPLGPLDVFSDLLSQGINRFELLLVAQSPEEDQLDLGLRQQFDGMEIEQMAFDGERVGPKGRAHADVGYCIEAFAVDARVVM